MSTQRDIVENKFMGKVSAYLELTKPRVNSLVVLTSAIGFCLASSGDPNLLRLVHLLLGTSLLGGGTAVLNQFLERESDGKMHRTRNRPLPSGRLSAFQAMVFGSVLIVVGALYLGILAHPLSALLGCSTAAIYLLIYTPLKTRTTICTTVGAIPGALPPLIGWAAASGELNFHALLLFAILFSWQYPHFLAISWIYKEDYMRGGVVMLPLFDPDGKRTTRHIVIFSIILLILSIIPATSGLSGKIYLVGAILLGVMFLGFGVGSAFSRSTSSARYVLRASVVYLPLLLILMIVDKV